MSKQFIIFIIGLPCSGKSSVAQFIAQRYDCVHLSTEQIRASLMEIDREDDDCDFTLQQQTDVYNKMSEELHFLLKSGKSVVVDGVYRSIDRRYFVFPSVRALIAACLMCSGVSKSGCPAPMAQTFSPAAFRASAFAVIARVCDG